MSDSYQMLVDVEATPSHAEEIARTVLDHFRKIGLIAGEENSDCVLGGTGYRPGPAVPDLYELGNREYPFWELVNCGVEPHVGRGFNRCAIGPSCEGFVCPTCKAEIEPFASSFDDAIGQAISAGL